MTAFAFSDANTVKAWDALTNTWTEETFHWGFLHVKLSNFQCLPEEFQDGLRSAGNEDVWTSTMDTLLTWRTFFWKCNEGFRRELLVPV